MRVQTRMRQMVEAGQFTGGVCPFGYRFVKSGVCNKKGKELVALEVVPEEAAIVQFIFHKTVAEGYGTWRLSDAVNALGYKTHRGAKFQSNTINRILHKGNDGMPLPLPCKGGEMEETIKMSKGNSK